MIVLTYDYELFFNRSGTVLRCLLEPTDRILELARHHGGMASTFFVDATHLLRSREESGSARDEFERIAAQLQRIVSEGHRVELHLHPHWLDAVRDGSDWRFPDYSRYRLHVLSQAEIYSLFISGVQVLQEIVSDVEADYRVRAFRAGGWCIQPSMPVVKAMVDVGINIDSSVGPGCFTVSQSHFFDFRGLDMTTPYAFDFDVTCPDSTGLCVEVPISTLRLTFADRLAKRLEIIRMPEDNRSFGDGGGMQVQEYSSRVLGKVFRRLKAEQTFLTLDNLSAYTVDRILQCAESYFCFVSHPKLMSAHSLRLLQRLGESPANKFVTVLDAAATLRGE